MMDRRLTLLPTPIMFPPSTGLSELIRPDGAALAAALAASSAALAEAGAPWPGGVGFVPFCVAAGCEPVCGGEDCAVPEDPGAAVCCGLAPAGAPSPGICIVCGGFRLPISWPAGPT